MFTQEGGGGESKPGYPEKLPLTTSQKIDITLIIRGEKRPWSQPGGWNPSPLKLSISSLGQNTPAVQPAELLATVSCNSFSHKYAHMNE